MHCNIPKIHPTTVIAVFHTNVRNHGMRAKMNVWLPKAISKLYTLADKCARAKEGRRLPGEEAGVEVNSEDDDDPAAPSKKNRKHNKKQKEKVVMSIEGLVILQTARKQELKCPTRKLLLALTAGR